MPQKQNKVASEAFSDEYFEAVAGGEGNILQRTYTRLLPITMVKVK
ncbi:hypothetical protein [Nostoc punctiforme]|nr:hypothetical protein [Nostoc punctiforme]